MEQDFLLPTGLIGRFAIVKLWPQLKTAEDECIARLKIAARSLGLECIEIHSDGRMLNDTDQIVTKKDVDFVIHLHYDTPKQYDVFSFVALWNPIQFYHEWGFARTSRNLLTHDDFLSCSSTPADDHVGRLIRNSAWHLPSFFNLYHSLADIVNPPSLGDFKLFYAGINWDALRGGVSRHQELLKCLDCTGDLRIYGPEKFQGVRVWKGYNSYVREIPFDGTSMIHEISKAGIALVLSSQAHKDSELMSNRLFESVAAGALVVCDENRFATNFFGDSLLYIDSRCDVSETADTIARHLQWAKSNQNEALNMVKRAQEIFRKKFSLTKCLGRLYQGFSGRRRDLLHYQKAPEGSTISICLYLLLPEYCEEVLNAHLNSVNAQDYESFHPVLVTDRAAYKEYGSSVDRAISRSMKPIGIIEADFFEHGLDKKINVRRKVGAVIADLLRLTPKTDAVVFVAPNETILSNHLQVLAFSLMRNPDTHCAATAAILKHGDNPVHSVHEKINFCQFDPALPIGFARFIFRLSGIPEDIFLALPYIDRKAMAILIGDNLPTQEIPSTVLIDVLQEFPSGAWDEGQENNTIGTFSPKAFTILEGFTIILPSLSYPLTKTSAALNVMRRLSWKWVAAQINAIRVFGLRQRLELLKNKLTSA